MCDCTSEEDNKPEIEVRRQPTNRGNLTSNAVPSCDCTSEDDSEPKKLTTRPATNRGKLKAKAAVPSCDCTSEDDSEPKVKTPKKLQSNVIASCDCTSEDDSSSGSARKSCDCTSDDTSNSGSSATKSCDCTSEDDSGGKAGICAADQDNLKSPFAIVQVELSKSVLDLLSSTESSSTSCDCKTSSTDASQGKVTCSTKDDSLVSCDCTSETSSSESVEREKKLECTLAIIKPEAVRFRKEIESIIDEEGFVIRQTRWLQMSPEQASEFYRDNAEQRNFARLVAYMSAKPIVVLVLSKLDAIREWRMLIGPTKVTDARVYAPDSIRGRYGSEGDDMQNAVHGSFDERTAEREIHFFFPDCVLESILRDEPAEEYLWRQINGVLSEGLVKCCEAKPEDPVVWLGNWLLDNEATRPKYL